jgi:hypothetical protein
LDWLLTLAAVATAVAFTWGADHWGWWVLASVCIPGLLIQIIYKLRFLHGQSVVRDLPPGHARRPAGTPAGRRLSQPPADEAKP